MLIGSLQHHDFIPYDNGADLTYLTSPKQAALRNLSHSYFTYDHGVPDKLFFPPLDKNANAGPTTIGSKTIPNTAWAWPFVDISYYKDPT
ncbi:hypothetical protein Aperf_G00000054254 [Anoplocephala perfoliata]